MTKTVFLAMAVMLGAAGCGDDHGHAADAGEHDHDVVFADAGPVDAPLVDAGEGARFAVPFRARVGAERFRCGQVFTGVGTQNSRWNPLDFRFYVHDLRLVTAAGEVPLAVLDESVWQREGVALLDFEDGTGACSNGNTPTNETVRVQAPTGTDLAAVTGLRFTLGLPAALNHRNAAVQASPFNLTGLWWSWQGGYKFVRLDGRVESEAGAVTVPAWNVHLGSTGCMGDAMGNVSGCAQPNRPTVTLTGFDPRSSAVVFDLGRLLAGADVSRSQNPAPGCMSGEDDADCAPVFNALGLRGGATQTAFSVVQNTAP
ncbi:MAG: metallo-mystery pair system four-Cys motif protein [Myxococcales bacterium]|nr:metallo-mystery pair system four-Cys motif protein [Myxococcales bacterium]